MARDQVAKLFLLAASTESEPEAMSALRQMRRVLEDDGLDVHAIAAAINLHLGMTKVPTLESLLDDMKANIDKGFAAAAMPMTPSSPRSSAMSLRSMAGS